MNLFGTFLSGLPARKKTAAFLALMPALVLLGALQNTFAQTARETGRNATPPSNRQLASPEI